MPKKLPKAVKPDEFKKLIKVMPSKERKIKVAFLLAYGSGLRISEITALQKDNVGETSIQIWDAKGGRDRVVPLPKGWKKSMLEVLPISTSVRTLQRKFKMYAKKANLPSYYTFHSLRHGFATRMVESKVPISHIQTLLGHSDISTTGIYLKARPEDALKSYEDLF